MKTKLLQSTIGARIEEVEKKAIEKYPQKMIIYLRFKINFVFFISVFLKMGWLT